MREDSHLDWHGPPCTDDTSAHSRGSHLYEFAVGLKQCDAGGMVRESPRGTAFTRARRMRILGLFCAALTVILIAAPMSVGFTVAPIWLIIVSSVSVPILVLTGASMLVRSYKEQQLQDGR